MAVEVRLDKTLVYQSSFPICHAVRDTALSRVQTDTRLSFSFKPARAIAWKGYRSEAGETTGAGRVVHGELWEAGADRDALLLGVTFAVGDTLYMNSGVVASPARRGEHELAEGLFVITYPVERRRLP